MAVRPSSCHTNYAGRQTGGNARDLTVALATSDGIGTVCLFLRWAARLNGR